MVRQGLTRVPEKYIYSVYISPSISGGFNGQISFTLPLCMCGLDGLMCFFSYFIHTFYYTYKHGHYIYTIGTDVLVYYTIVYIYMRERKSVCMLKRVKYRNKNGNKNSITNG